MPANTILLKGDLGQRHEEYRASAALKPGHLLMVNSSGQVLKHNAYGGVNTRMYAKEDALQGKTVLDTFVIGDLVPVHVGKNNDKVQARLPAGAAAVVIGDYLVSNGDGCLVKGSAAGSGALVYENTTPSTAVSNTTVETEFDRNYTFPANSLKAGDVIRVRAQVIATATNATDTLTVRLYFGGLAGILVVNSGALDVANGDVCVIDGTIIIRTDGATGTLVATGFVSIGTPGTATGKTFALGSTAVNTTVAQKLSLSATWSVANAGDSARLDILTVSQEHGATGAGGGGNLAAFAAEAVNNSAGVDEAFCAVWLV